MKISRTSFFGSSARGQKAIIWTQVFVLALFSLVPLVAGTNKVNALPQLTERSIEVSTSKPSATNVTYKYGFKPATTGTLQSVKFEACTTPLGTCTAPGGTTQMNAGSESARSGWAGSTTFTRTAGSNDCTAANNILCIHRTDVTSEGTSAKSLTWDTQTNPTAVASYYVRITTYSDDSWNTAVDEGVVAYAIINQLTVNARVQENLQFCVGATTVDDATTSPGGDCSNISGSTVDIGAIDTTIATSPVPVTPNGGNNLNGVAMVRTNANNGTIIGYFAEQNMSSGKLKVTGATCSGTSTTDQCFNSQGATQGTFVAATENFGMTIGGVNCGSTTAYSCAFASDTNNLKQLTDYIGNTATAYGTSTGFAWVDTGTATTPIASSASSTIKVLDDEALILKFAAVASATTPTGAYTVVSTYIATPTF